MFPVNNNHSQILKVYSRPVSFGPFYHCLGVCLLPTWITALCAGIIQASLAHLQPVQNAAVYFSTGTYINNIQPTGI